MSTLLRPAPDAVTRAPTRGVGVRPRLERAADGRPRLALTLVLERHPAAGEPDIAPLVVRGVFAMTVELVPETTAVPDEGTPLFVRSGQVRLVVPDGESSPVDAVEVAGSARTAVLASTVDAEVALVLLEALRGAPGVFVEHDLQVPTEPTIRSIGLRGRWIDVWDVLRTRTDDDGRLRIEDLTSVARLCVTTGVVDLLDGDLPPTAESLDAATELLVGSARAVLTEVDDAAGDVGFRLRRPPSSVMMLAVDEERTLPAVQVLHGRSSLASLLEPEAGEARTELDALVRLVALDPHATGSQVPVVPVPRATPATRSRAGGRDELVAIGKEPLGVHLMLSNPVDVGSASAGSAYQALAVEPRLLHATLVASVVAVPPAELAPEPGPIITGGQETLLVDHADPSQRWYIPEYRIVVPEPGTPPAGSPYLFTLVAAGLASGTVPTVGLDATMRITLQPGIGEAARRELDALGNPPAQPVAVSELSASLEVPYRLEGSPDIAFHSLTGEVVASADGALVLTVRALDHVARLSYGSLAYEGFQAADAAVTVRFSFAGWQRTGGRSARGPLGVGRNGQFRDRLLNGGLIGDRLLHLEVLQPHIKTKPGTPWYELPIDKVAPPVRWEPVNPVPAPTWVQVAVGHAARVPATLPCATHPDLYRQVGGGVDRPLGCQDALRLGEAAPPAYADIPSLASRSYRVLRSLQQPGRFVVLPAAFRITRLGPEAGERAFRPAVLVHAALGGATGDRYVITASLGPAIALQEWNALREQLRALCPAGVEPQMQLPVDPTLQSEAADRWTVPDDIAEPVLTRTWDGFQVMVSTGLTDGLLLNAAIETTGITGEVTFTVGDVSIRSTLVLDTDVVGPWPGSALTTEVLAGKVRVTNHAERTADVSELIDSTGSVVARVDAPVGPGEIIEVPVALAGAGGDARVVAVHSLRAAQLSISQISTYVSDVTTTVSVLNLVNFANHSLARIDVEVRSGDGHVESREVPEGATTDFPLTFPLTGYLSARAVELRTRATFTDGRTEDTPWIARDLATTGNVVSLTSQLIGLSPS